MTKNPRITISLENHKEGLRRGYAVKSNNRMAYTFLLNPLPINGHYCVPQFWYEEFKRPRFGCIAAIGDTEEQTLICAYQSARGKALEQLTGMDAEGTAFIDKTQRVNERGLPKKLFCFRNHLGNQVIGTSAERKAEERERQGLLRKLNKR